MSDKLSPANTSYTRQERLADDIQHMLKNVRDSDEVTEAVHLILCELISATAKFGKFNSAHEGAAVFLEEVDELWDHVKVKQSKRDIPAMRGEAVQCAAMAIRFAVDCCNEIDGRR